MSTSQPRVLLVGSGAIGSFYGAILHRAGADVAVVSRSDYKIVSECGFTVHSPLGDLSFRPRVVLRSAAEYEGAPDFVVLSVKVFDNIDRAALIRPVVGPNTSIVLIENGIEIELEIAEAFPDNPIISGLAFVAVSRSAPGTIEHKAHGELVLGDYPSGASEASQQFGDLLTRGGVKGHVTDRIVHERWRKAVWNTAFNPISVLAGGADTTTILNACSGEATMRDLMAEVVAVAAATGHPLPEDIIDANIKTTTGMAPFKTSMAQDFINDRPLELEAILGNVIRDARKHDVSVPRLEMVYALVRMLLGNRST